MSTISNVPFISCICPTYKRPKHLANMVKCFEGQDYPVDRCELIILDDAAQYEDSVVGNWRMISKAERFESLPRKFNFLAKRAQGQIIVVMEDDDIYLPDHLKAIGAAYHNAFQFFYSRHVYSTYEVPFGTVRTEESGGRFHASWAFTKSLFNHINGYKDDTCLSFDHELRTRLEGGGRSTVYSEVPTYVYRWGNGIYHGSQAGDADYPAFYNSLDGLRADFVGQVNPKFDQETLEIFQNLSVLGFP